MQKSVAILFANLKGNIGDFAILDAMLRETTRRFPGRRIDVYPHGFLEADHARLEAFRAAGAPRFEIAGGTYHRSVPPKLKRLYRFGLWPWVQRRLVDSLRRASRDDARRFAEYEAIFLAGGDQWNAMDLGVSMFGTLLAVAEHNRNIYHYPFSLNPAARTFNTAADLRRYFKAVRQPIVVRDGISHDVMTDLGIPTVLGHDTVFSLSGIGQQIPPLESRDRERILLVLTGPHDRALLVRTLGDVLERLKGAGRPIEMLTTCWNEDLHIYEDLGRQHGVAVRAPLTWQETIAELKQSAVVVTDRLHCLILGTFAECTLFPVADRKKAEAFVRDTGTPHYGTGMQDVTPDALEAAIADRAAILEKIRAYRDIANERDTAPRLMAEA
ncbi:polysaccharide pyruvyl transferase family protein [uncultured Mameliella sp.]|uniref:polysaccharide pyruvyl transferase family protein n=1 Tax=uncultured Mameliella sp. TaxID=1447087 RepID=UPI0026213FE4|nr:polysaccharide pyruvyl transferase family protein [uncultured Mameliella sp.]